MRTLLLIVMALLCISIAITSCSDSNATEDIVIENNVARRKVISHLPNQIIPIFMLKQDLAIYKVGDTVNVFKASSGDYYYTTSQLIDSTSIIAVIQKGTTSN